MIQMLNCLLHLNISECNLSKLTSATQLQRRKDVWDENRQLQEETCLFSSLFYILLQFL